MKTKMNRCASFLMACGVAGALCLSGPVLGQEPEAPKEPAKKVKKGGDEALSVNPTDPNAKSIYVITMGGELGKDFSVEALKDIMKDVEKVQPDYLVVYFDTTWKSFKGRDVSLYNEQDAQQSFDLLERVAEMEGVLTDGIRDNPKMTKKPELIGWVNRALGPGAFVPFVCPKIYYTPNAIHGGIGYLDTLFAGRGDEVVREKQRSLRMGRAEGMAIKGGHDWRILRAMCRVDYELSYTLVGGKPVFYENRTDGEVLLTDDGKDDRQDSLEDMLRFKGDDVLNLNANVARKIGFIEGEAATLDELAYELGTARAYRVYKDTAAKISEQWRQDGARWRAQFNKLREAVRTTQVTGDTAADRNAVRGRIKRDLMTMADLLAKHAEALFGIQPQPLDEQIDQIKQRIAELDQEMRLDRDQKRGPGGMPGMR